MVVKNALEVRGADDADQHAAEVPYPRDGLAPGHPLWLDHFAGSGPNRSSKVSLDILAQKRDLNSCGGSGISETAQSF